MFWAGILVQHGDPEVIRATSFERGGSVGEVWVVGWAVGGLREMW